MVYLLKNSHVGWLVGSLDIYPKYDSDQIWFKVAESSREKIFKYILATIGIFYILDNK